MKPGDDFQQCKICKSPTGQPRYRIGPGTVYRCSQCGLDYLDHLDDLEALAREPLRSDPADHFRYVDTVLQAEAARFEARVARLATLRSLAAARCLDIGAGGGLFLHLLARRGAQIEGIEPDPLNRLFARQRYGIELTATPMEAVESNERDGTFDIVSLWDVIEHVNLPRETLAAAVRALVPGGLLCLDTPMRDGFLYRIGEWGYRGTGGWARGLLGAQYSRQPFGHKQIFPRRGLVQLIESLGCAPVRVEAFQELRFPCREYLQHFLRSRRASRLLAPGAALFFRLFPFPNKVLVIAKKR